MSQIQEIYESEAIKSLVLELDNYSFQKDINEDQDLPYPSDDEMSNLWSAAALSIDDNLSSNNIEDSLDSNKKYENWASKSFDKWFAYIDSTSTFTSPDQRDIISLIATGLASERHTELRQILTRTTLENSWKNSSSEDWQLFVRSTVNRSIFLLARQKSKDDIKTTISINEDLRSKQSIREQSWLESRTNKEQSALSLLSLYHLSSATDTLAKYLSKGVITTPLGREGNIENELSVLIGKSEKYAELTSDPELLNFVKTVKITINKLRSDTIWSNTKNINEIIDNFLSSLTQNGRPLYSMLPSQQEALRKNFLNTQREAVVLQMPTSSGKTLLAELAALNAIASYNEARVVYLTPTRALSTQVKRTLNSDFKKIGIEVTSAGSAFEEDPYEIELLKESSGVVVSTPEKMDLLLRSHPDWFSKVRLLIVDEAHLIKDGERGARLELLLANFRREFPHIRMLLLTPFVQNANELASWLSEDRGAPVDVHWRPSRLIIGLATFKSIKGTRAIDIEWKEPHRASSSILKTNIFLNDKETKRIKQSSSALTKTAILGDRLKKIGPVLGMFPSSRSHAETAAKNFASEQAEFDLTQSSPEHRVAVALAEVEYGEKSLLAYCLKRGVAYHHSALSGELRYLIERLAASGKLSFLSATTTLAQGMNFPVSSVIIHSLSKPNRGGNLTPAEFWNIAGRAGRVGLSERGLVVFANSGHRELWEYYTEHLSDRIDSALNSTIENIKQSDSIKWIYKIHEPIRPFLQYLSHASALIGIKSTYSDLERLVEASLSGKNKDIKEKLLNLARRYLSEIAHKQQSYLKAADKTGLSSYSFDQLFAHIRSDQILMDGNPDLLSSRAGLKHLVDALVNLPELSLALERGRGTINTELVAKVVHSWISGASIAEISPDFVGKDEAERIRAAGTYVFSKVSQTVSWGAHAYLRGRAIANTHKNSSENEATSLLPAYIQYGVNNPEALVASILGVPRSVASGVAAFYSEKNGPLKVEESVKFRQMLEASDKDFWESSISKTKLSGKVTGADMRYVWREAQGLRTDD